MKKLRGPTMKANDNNLSIIMMLKVLLSDTVIRYTHLQYELGCRREGCIALNDKWRCRNSQEQEFRLSGSIRTIIIVMRKWTKAVLFDGHLCVACWSIFFLQPVSSLYLKSLHLLQARFRAVRTVLVGRKQTAWLIEVCGKEIDREIIVFLAKNKCWIDSYHSSRHIFVKRLFALYRWCTIVKQPS